MAVSQEPIFDTPIPGISLTAELGGRPWQNPPRFSTVDEATDYYIERMSSDEFARKLVAVLELGVPITTIADVMSLSSVMEGVHSADVGILVSPVLVEFMILIADSADIEYKTGLEETDDPSKAAINRAIVRFKKQKVEDSEPETIEENNVAADMKLSGLMSRRL